MTGRSGNPNKMLNQRAVFGAQMVGKAQRQRGLGRRSVYLANQFCIATTPPAGAVLLRT